MNSITPLHAEHLALGARMAPFSGWDMPIQYAGILAEHQHTRTVASLFDICHMGEFEVEGPQAEADLERLLTLRVSTIREGQCRYGYLLNETGGVLDDLTCYRRGPDRFFLVVNAGTRERDAEWIRARCSPDTRFEDVSDRLAKLDVQGPESRAAMEVALGVSVPELKYFGFAEVDWDGMPCLISRTGYTGEWGYELYFPADQAVRIWRKLLAPGVIKPAGLGARDTLRLEVAYTLYGHELTEAHTPVSAAGASFMDLQKEFIGKSAVERDLAAGVPYKLAGLHMGGKRAARAHDVVFFENERVGEVTSGSLAPSLGVAVALAYVRADLTSVGQALEIEVHGKRLPVTVVDRPFYTQGTARKKR